MGYFFHPTELPRIVDTLLVEVEVVEDLGFIRPGELLPRTEREISGMIEPHPALHLYYVGTKKTEEAGSVRPCPGRCKFSKSHAL